MHISTQLKLCIGEQRVKKEGYLLPQDIYRDSEMAPFICGNEKQWLEELLQTLDMRVHIFAPCIIARCP